MQYLVQNWYQPMQSEPHCIIISVQLQYPVNLWLQNLLEYAGVTRLTSTLTALFWFSQILQMMNRAFKHWTYYRRFEINTQKYDKLHPNDTSHLNPWYEVHVDMILHWKVTINNFEYQFRAVTCIGAIMPIYLKSYQWRMYNHKQW